MSSFIFLQFSLWLPWIMSSFILDISILISVRISCLTFSSSAAVTESPLPLATKFNPSSRERKFLKTEVFALHFKLVSYFSTRSTLFSFHKDIHFIWNYLYYFSRIRYFSLVPLKIWVWSKIYIKKQGYGNIEWLKYVPFGWDSSVAISRHNFMFGFFFPYYFSVGVIKLKLFEFSTHKAGRDLTTRNCCRFHGHVYFNKLTFSTASGILDHFWDWSCHFVLPSRVSFRLVAMLHSAKQMYRQLCWMWYIFEYRFVTEMLEPTECNARNEPSDGCKCNHNILINICDKEINMHR